MNQLIKTITDFVFVEHTPCPSDIIFIPGSGYGALSKMAASLYHDHLAPCILPSGKYTKIIGHFQGSHDNLIPVSEKNPQTECDYLAALLIDYGVPSKAILRETKAEYTYQNAIFSKELTDQAGLHIKRAILCCQAFHARRALMYYELLYPDTIFYVCPVETQGINRHNWYTTQKGMDIVFGEVERCGSQFKSVMKEKMLQPL